MNKEQNITFWGIIGSTLIAIGFVIYYTFAKHEFPPKSEIQKRLNKTHYNRPETP